MAEEGAPEVGFKFKRIAPRFELDKKSAAAVKVSNFMITLNTNSRIGEELDNDAVEALTTPMYDMAEALFGSPRLVSRFVQFGRMSDATAADTGKRTFEVDEGIEFNNETIYDVNVTAGVEIGHNAMGKRLHMHIGLRVRHRSCVHLDHDKIQEMANDELERSGFMYPIQYVSIRTGKPSFEDYLDIKE